MLFLDQLGFPTGFSLPKFFLWLVRLLLGKCTSVSELSSPHQAPLLYTLDSKGAWIGFPAVQSGQHPIRPNKWSLMDHILLVLLVSAGLFKGPHIFMHESLSCPNISRWSPDRCPIHILHVNGAAPQANVCTDNRTLFSSRFQHRYASSVACR